jgi:hypothetical protein
VRWSGCGAAGTYANLVRQAKSKQKILDKMEAAGLTKPVVHHKTFSFTFPECEKLPPPVLPFVNVSFAYSGKEADMLYRVRCCACACADLHIRRSCAIPTSPHAYGICTASATDAGICRTEEISARVATCVYLLSWGLL